MQKKMIHLATMNPFKLAEKKTTIKNEFIGGLTTFLTMVYIIFIHPSILSETGMDKGALITVTCLLVFASTVLVGLWANVPFAMAPGMGLNAFFTYTVVIGQNIPWQTALGIV
ncbi:MAG: NCS2 family permease, partial [Saprospiraceae bacterium]|nr:NCS2 family permease [Saprospiraceae bacterium]